ncbi:hypothetical protein [Rhodothermus profundi]|uniref:Uncharacterized protein n=1 Tax=Rhodothermus profundi TaxID=633813 RepID=A0A1M6PFI9_9BACT|nr:hypothetical protein [Rhodothermus profundi]SHK06684.1 hypothetical protein SAMN04488087_0163 [Rhodothermus profundi]
MLLVRAGAYTINVERVLFFRETEQGLEVTFALHDQERAALHTLQLSGKDAAQLRQWLERNAEGAERPEAGFALGS